MNGLAEILKAIEPLGLPVYSRADIAIVNGDCRVAASLLESCIDSIVCDPPYELGFMGKRWDSTGVAFDAATWAAMLRVAKPGAHLLAFGGTRTYHRMACAIEDAGWEIRDCLMWVYGSGFPKSMDVSKAIDKAAGAEREVVGKGQPRGATDKYAQDEYSRSMAGKAFDITAPATDAARQWSGWGTALKPAFEPIILARKPIEGTVAANVLKWGTGGINIDGCRIGTESTPRKDPRNGNLTNAHFEMRPWMKGRIENGEPLKGDFDGNRGRWPANVIHDGSEEVLRHFPHTQSGLQLPKHTRHNQRLGAGGIYGNSAPPDADPLTETYGDSGSAARFFYTAKADKSERNGSKHPTVKPLDLMQYLVRLVTPPSGICLDGFLGSGTTAEACFHEGFACIGIEQDTEHGYFADACERIAKASRQIALIEPTEPPPPRIEQAELFT